MKRINKLKQKANKKYPLGGRFGDIVGDIKDMNISDIGNLSKNFGQTIADTALTSIGLGNIIPNEAYKGGNNNGKIADTLGGIGKTALPLALQAVGVPMIATKAAQTGLGMLNPKEQDQQMFPNGGTLLDPMKPYININSPYAGNLLHPNINPQFNPNLTNIAQATKFNVGKAVPLTPIVDPNKSSQLLLYPNGGVSQNPNAELEKEEVFQTPDGIVQQVNGGTHEQGGVAVNIPQGTRIWSDRLKLKGKTFAKHAAKYKTEKEEEILKDTTADNRAKQTAQLNMTAKNKKLDELFNQQESLKVSQQTNDLYRCGGMVKMKNGGIKYDIDQEYDLDEKEINRLKKLGFDIEII